MDEEDLRMRQILDDEIKRIDTEIDRLKSVKNGLERAREIISQIDDEA